MPLECKARLTEELLLFITGRGILTVNDIADFSEFFDAHLCRQDPFKLFLDLRKVEKAHGDTLTALIKHITSFEDRARDKVIATSVVVSSIPIVSLINLLFTIKQPLTPTKVTSNLTEACDFLNNYSASD